MSDVGSVSITNYTKDSIEITTVPNNTNGPDPKRKYTIPPKESFVFFTDRVDSLHWEKVKQG